MLPLHLSNNKNSTQWNCTVVGNRVMSNKVTRIIARSGYPNTTIGDNGTNIFAVANELKAFLDACRNDKVGNDLAQKKFVWNFNPSGAPLLGGTWKRLTQICKKIISAILDNRSLTDIVLSTTMRLVEQILSARHLTAVNDDPDDLTSFLLGQENARAPFMSSSEHYHDLRNSFKTVKAYTDIICENWTREDLPKWNEMLK